VFGIENKVFIYSFLYSNILMLLLKNDRWCRLCDDNDDDDVDDDDDDVAKDDDDDDN